MGLPEVGSGLLGSGVPPGLPFPLPGGRPPGIRKPGNAQLAPIVSFGLEGGPDPLDETLVRALVDHQDLETVEAIRRAFGG